jgi:excisionase family DNA binding protein
MFPKLLTTQQAAELLTVSAHTLAVWRCVQRYELPYIKVGRSIRYREEDVLAFLAKGGSRS